MPATTEPAEQDDDPILPADCPLTRLHRKRIAQNRDLTIFISDWNLERGSGKTTLALRLAAALDRTDEGITPDRATLSARELTRAYVEQPLGAALLFDEAEGDVSNRRSTSTVNEAVRKIVSMGRVEQKYLLFTAPGVHFVDKDVRAMCDLWIFTREVGEAQMFRVGYNPFGGKVLTYDWGTLTWSRGLPGELEATYRALTQEKRRRLRGEGDDGDGFVDASDAREEADRAEDRGRRQKRDEMIRDMYENDPDLTQKKLGDLVGLSRSRIADILTDD